MRENCDTDEVSEEVGNNVIGGRSEWAIPVSPGRGQVVGVIVVEDVTSQ